MSELTQCNYCKLLWIRSEAKKNRMKVTVLCESPHGGFSVYAHPRGIKIDKLPGGYDGERKKYRRSWMMDISSSCCC